MSKEKTGVGKFLQKAAKVVRFGAVEAIKGGTPVGFVLNTIEKFTGKDLATGEAKSVEWSKVIYKAIGAAIIMYLLAKGYIPVDVVLDFINKFV